MPGESVPLQPVPVQIEAFQPTDEIRLARVADVMFRAMEPVSSRWPAHDAALGELIELCRAKAMIVLIALDPAGEVCGLVAASPRDAAHVLALEWITVDPLLQRCGIGRSLMGRLAQRAAEAGYETLAAAVCDEIGHTSLAGLDLYPEPLEKLATMTFSGPHPAEFFRKTGFALTGVLPDAGGRGIHEIQMALKLTAPNS